MTQQQKEKRALEILQEARTKGVKPQRTVAPNTGGSARPNSKIHPSVQAALDKTEPKLTQTPASTSTEPEFDDSRYGNKKLSAIETGAAEAGRTILRTAAGGASLFERGANSLMKIVLPKAAESAFGLDNAPTLRNDVQSTVEKVVPQDLLARGQSTASKVGRTVGETLPYLLPGGAAARASRVASIYAKAKGVGRVGSMAIRLGTAALTEGAGAGAIAAAQNDGKVDETTRNTALLSGAFPLAGAVAGKVSAPLRKYLAQKVSPRIANAVIKPISNAFNFGKNPGRVLGREQISANTLGGLKKQLVKRGAELGDVVGEALERARPKAKLIDMRKILSSVDKAIQDAVEGGEQVLVKRLQDVKDGLTKEFRLVASGGLEQVGQKPSLITVTKANEIKKKVGVATKWTNQAFDNEVNAVRVQIYRALNDEIDGAVKTAIGKIKFRNGEFTVKQLNRRLADIISAEKSLQRTIDVGQRQNLIPFTEKTLGAATIAASLAQGQGTPESVAYGLLAAGSLKLARNPATLTRLAKNLGKFSAEELKGVSKLIPTLKAIGLEINQSLRE